MCCRDMRFLMDGLGSSAEQRTAMSECRDAAATGEE